MFLMKKQGVGKGYALGGGREGADAPVHRSSRRRGKRGRIESDCLLEERQKWKTCDTDGKVFCPNSMSQNAGLLGVLSRKHVRRKDTKS